MLAEKTDSANKIAVFANMGKKTAKNIANKKVFGWKFNV